MPSAREPTFYTLRPLLSLIDLSTSLSYLSSHLLSRTLVVVGAHIIPVRLLHSLQNTSEIATVKVYEAMYMLMQREPIAKTPYCDGDEFCLAAPLDVLQITLCQSVRMLDGT